MKRKKSQNNRHISTWWVWMFPPQPGSSQAIFVLYTLLYITAMDKNISSQLLQRWNLKANWGFLWVATVAQSVSSSVETFACMPLFCNIVLALFSPILALPCSMFVKNQNKVWPSTPGFPLCLDLIWVSFLKNGLPFWMIGEGYCGFICLSCCL